MLAFKDQFADANGTSILAFMHTFNHACRTGQVSLRARSKLIFKEKKRHPGGLYKDIPEYKQQTLCLKNQRNRCVM